MTTITVLDSIKGKFGPQLKDKDGYLSFGKFYHDAVVFDKGTVLEVDLFVSEKGNRYINAAKVVEQAKETPAPRGRMKAKPEPVNTVPQPVTPEYKPRDYDKENRGKVKSLFLEAILSNPNVVTEDNIIELLKDLADSETQEALNKLVESVF